MNFAHGDEDSQTPLQVAAEGGHLGVVDRLLSVGADVNAEQGKWTALRATTGEGHLVVADRLLTAGADTNAQLYQHNGRTALQAAAESWHLHMFIGSCARAPTSTPGQPTILVEPHCRLQRDPVT